MSEPLPSPVTSTPPTDIAARGAVQNNAAQRRLFVVILAAVFLVAAEARVISPLLPAIAQDFTTTVARAGLLITLYSIPYGLFQLVYGPLADRFSRQRVMGVALALFAIGTFVSGFAPDLWILDVLRFATGAAAAGIIPVALAYVGDAVPYHERQAALGRVVSISALGGVLSAALGGIVATAVSWRAMFLGYGLLSLLVAALLIRSPRQPARAKAAPRTGLLTPYIAIFRAAGWAAVALYLLVFIEGATATSTLGFLGALLYERDHLDYATIGIVLTLNGVGSLITGRLVGRIVRRMGERGMLLLGGVLMTIAYVLVSLQPWLVFFPLAMLLSGAGFVIAHSTLQARATELVPAQRGTAVAFFAFALFLGGGLGTYIASLVIDTAGFRAAVLGTAAAIAVFTVVAPPLMNIVQRGR